jgi:hypothetical protein
MAPKTRTVERPIYFCRALVDGNYDPEATAKVIAFLPEIEKLPFKFGGRYGADPEELRWPCMWIHRSTNPPRMQLSWLTDKDLPQTEIGGAVAPLALGKGQHLHYPTHMVMFPKGILGYEYWRPGPGPWVLAEYLNDRGFPGTLSFQFLYKLDTLAELERLKEFRSLHLKIPASLSDVLAAADESIGTSLKVLGKLGDDVEVELKISPVSQRGPLKGLARIVNRLRGITKESGAKKLEVVGYDEETHERVTIDLLSSRLMQKREMVLLGAANKAVEPESAYQAIERSFNQQRGQIYDSAGTET